MANTKQKKEEPTTKKVKIIKPVAGKYLLSYDVNKEYEIAADLATILINDKYAKEV